MICAICEENKATEGSDLCEGCEGDYVNDVVEGYLGEPEADDGDLGDLVERGTGFRPTVDPWWEGDV